MNVNVTVIDLRHGRYAFAVEFISFTLVLQGEISRNAVYVCNTFNNL
jgi:hypothetical protein